MVQAQYEQRVSDIKKLELAEERIGVVCGWVLHQAYGLNQELKNLKEKMDKMNEEINDKFNNIERTK